MGGWCGGATDRARRGLRALGVAACAACAAGGWSGSASAQVTEVVGEVRPRFEVRAEGSSPWSEEAVELTSMRTRAGVSALLGGEVRAFVQLQDVRVWGSEASTTDGAADALDVHQGWLELGGAAAGWSVRAGRQEVAYGGERLIGALNWAQQGRAFDGVRVRIGEPGGTSVDGLAMRLSEGDVTGVDAGLYGVYGTALVAGEVQGYALYDRSEAVEDAGPPPAGGTGQYTLGGRWSGAEGPVTWRLEGAYQTGERAGRDVRAHLMAVRVGTALWEGFRASLWYDRLSGDEDPEDGEARVFDTLFATNHKFYGYMDLFLNIPVDTRGRGLQDLALKARYALSETVGLGADVHAFRVAAAGDLDTSRLGQELDLTASWAYAPGVTLSGGVSHFDPAGGWSAALGRADESRVWGYVMLGGTF